MQVIWDQITRLVGAYIPNFIAALAILIVGWLVALILSAIVRGVLRRTTLDNRVARWIMGEKAAEGVEVEKQIARGVYYLIMLFVLIAFFQTLGLTIITEPLYHGAVSPLVYRIRP